MIVIEIIWEDGSMTSGRSWRELEDEIRVAQWQPYKSRREFRKDMRRRARIWSGAPVKSTGYGSRAFIESLARSGLIQIHKTEDMK